MPPIRLTLHLSWLTVFFGQADDIALARDFENRPIDADSR
jgi:hypothetical protein